MPPEVSARAHDDALIELERARWGSVDVFRAYVVRVDGSKHGRIRRGERKRFAVEPGRHRLRLTIDWAGSPELELTLAPGETARFECRPRANLLTAVYWATIGRRRYIDLRPTGTAEKLPKRLSPAD
jgi:hypothetical protein